MKLFKSFYIQPRFFYAGACIVILFVFSYYASFLFIIAQLLILIVLLLFFIDVLILFPGKGKIDAKRNLPDKFSNGDLNEIVITIKNQYFFLVDFIVIDEVPVQFQIRDFKRHIRLKPDQEYQMVYQLRPLQRGVYQFGSLNIYTSSKIGLVTNRFCFGDHDEVPTYPSFKQLRKFELFNINHSLQDVGVKKIRKIGHTMEFEQIKDYTIGDDVRTINWKASAKKNSLMVNQFQDERSQAIYSIIDKGRVMKMPFEGLSLLDYAINASLVISSIALKKQDKAGMLSFSNKVENIVVAQRRNSQMRMILESLYNIKTDFYESDFSRLYGTIKRSITQRSLILLYTNFETLESLNRQMAYLKAIARNHLMVVIFFKNTELDHVINKKASTVQEVYDKVIAEKFAFEKRLIVQELRKYGIYSILTTPKNLTIDTINKYLEIKSRGLL